MVAPLREMPGSTAMPWNTPLTKPDFASRGRSFAVHSFSEAKSTTAVVMKPSGR